MYTTRPHIVVCALYRFVTLDNFEALQAPLLAVMQRYAVKGTILLAHEGINGTVAGTRSGIDAVLAWLRHDPRLLDIDHKESFDDEIPFYRSKVKLKNEIVTMGIEGIDPRRTVGTHIDPQDWNSLISDPDVLLIDTRNEYEVEIGTFKGALNPHTDSFRELPEYVRQHLDPAKHKKIAMFCTGGIRCEKSTAYLKEQGFPEVYHLKGGILKYLEEVPAAQSMWQGECFVFDNRVAVNHQLEKGGYDQCHACRLPITEADKAHVHYEKGVSCHRCFGRNSDDQLRNLRERQRQIELAAARGEAHLGSEASLNIAERRARKLDYKASQHALTSKAEVNDSG